MIAITGVAIIFGYVQVGLLKRIQAGTFVTDEQVNRSDLMAGIIGIVQTVIYFTSVVVFIQWFRRAYGNLHRHGNKVLNHKEEMALWSWFIPIVSLGRPVTIMNEIWNKTQENIREYQADYQIKKGGLMIGVWWALFLFSNVVGNIVLRTALNANTVDELINSTTLYLISDASTIPEALLVILIVSKISKMESHYAEEAIAAGESIIVDVRSAKRSQMKT